MPLLVRWLSLSQLYSQYKLKKSEKVVLQVLGISGILAEAFVWYYETLYYFIGKYRKMCIHCVAELKCVS